MAHCRSQLNQALSGRFNSHVHVEYEWRLLHEDLDESDDDMDEKLQVCASLQNMESFMMSILQSGVGPGLIFRAESCCGKGNTDLSSFGVLPIPQLPLSPNSYKCDFTGH